MFAIVFLVLKVFAVFIRNVQSDEWLFNVHERMSSWSPSVQPGVGVEKWEKKHRVILSCYIFGQNGAVQIEHLYEEECKTAQAGSALPWSVACHKTACQKGNEKAYSATNGLDGLEFSIDPVWSELLDWHHVFRPRNWCRIAVLPSLLLEAPSC